MSGPVAVLTLALNASVPAFAQERVQFNVPAVEPATAIRAFSEQSRTQILASAEGFHDRPLNPVVGVLSTDEALVKLLAGTGLSHRYVGDRTVALVSDEQATDEASQPLREHNFDIPAQPLSSALIAFSQQSGVIVVADPAVVNGRQAPAVQGSFTPTEALAQLLAGSGLSASPRPDGRFVLANLGSPLQRGAASPTAPNDLNEIVVTGTHIRGITNATSPANVYDREEIESSGYGSTQEFIRALPENFKGGQDGASEEGFLVNGLSFDAGSGVNLRGLGPNSTLILLNGRRVGPSSYGRFFDVSLLPLGVIDRVEVLTDGASAIYGADAVGGVVNFITRDNYEGAETSVRYATTANSDRTEFDVGQALGTTWNGGNIVASLQYQEQGALSALDRSFASELGPTYLYPDTEQYSALVSAGHELSSDFEVFGDLLVNRRDVTREQFFFGNPLMESTRVEYGNANLGFGWEVFGNWRVEGTGSYSRSETVFREIRTTELPGYISGEPQVRNTYTQYEGVLKADGTLFTIPGGEVKLALGTGYRNEDFSSLIVYLDNDRPFERDVVSAFSELDVPLVGVNNDGPFLRRLGISLAVRFDDYSDFGSTTNPKFGLLWAPHDDLNIRASFGSSFRAPNANESILIDAVTGASGLDAFIFPFFQLPGGGLANTLLYQDPLPLIPEEAETVSFGFDWQPGLTPGLTVSASVYSIEYEDRIIFVPFNADVLLRPEFYGDLLTQFSTPAEAQAFADNLMARGYNISDFTPEQMGPSGALAAYRFGLINAAQVRQKGADLSVDYDFALGTNDWRLGTSVAYIETIDTSLCENCAFADIVNTFGQPLQLRSRTTFGWTRGDFSVDAAVNYANSYDDTNVAPPDEMDSWITTDLNFRYAPSALPGIELSLAATNVFDEAPPETEGIRFIGGFFPLSYDPANADSRGRVVALQIRKIW